VWPLVVLALLAGALILVLGSPLWVPWVAGSVAERFGIESAGIERAGWTRLRFTDVEGSIGDARLKARSIELPQPLAWLARLARGGSTNRPAIVVSDWTLVIEDSAEQAPADGRFDSTTDVLNAAGPLLDQLDWLGGPAVFRRGTVHFGRSVVEIPSGAIDSQGSKVTASAGQWQASAAINRAPGGALDLQMTVLPWDAELGARATPTNGGWVLRGALRDATNRLDVSAVFREESWLPARAAVAGVDLRLPLPATVSTNSQADLRVTWAGGKGDLSLSATGTTHLPTAPEAVPLTAEVSATFTANAVEIAAVEVDSEILTLRLDSPVRIVRTNVQEWPAATLEFAARLEALGRPGLAGLVTGTVVSKGASQAGPNLEFSIGARGVQARGVSVREATASGTIQWPRLQLADSRARFENGAELVMKAEADLKRRELLASTVTFEGIVPVAPTNTHFTWPSLSISASATGPLTTFTNLTGRLEATTLEPLQISGVRPMHMTVRSRFSGTTAESVEITAATEASQLMARLAARLTNGSLRELHVRVEELAIQEGQTTILGLDAPFETTARLAAPGSASRIEVSASPARFEGAAGAVALQGSVRWPERGELSLSVSQLALGFVTNWVLKLPPALGEVRARVLALEGRWDNGPVEGTFRFHGEGRVPGLGRIEAQGAGGIDSAGVRLESGQIVLQQAAPEQTPREAPIPGEVTGRATGSALEEGALRASVQLPVRISIDGAGLALGAIPQARLAGEIDIPADAWVWGFIESRLRMSCSEPSLRIELAGTGEAPEVRVAGSARLARLSSRPGGAPIELENVELRAHATPEAAVVNDLRLQLKGQQILAEGRWPLMGGSAERGWTDLRPGDWREADARLLIAGAELAPLTEPWRELLQPRGILRADARLRQGALTGWVEVTNVATRPRGPIGAIHDFALRLSLEADRVTVEHGSGSLNGQLVDLSGWVGLPTGSLGTALGRNPRQPDMDGARSPGSTAAGPAVASAGTRAETSAAGDGSDGPQKMAFTADLRVSATNLTVLRSAGALVRADLDVALLSTNAGWPPLITGTVTLRDSVVMRDVRDFVGVNLERPEQRPPYFSVSQPYLGTWGLDLRLRGERFARVLSPVFRGTVSADLRLLGSLQHPRLLGSAVVDSGQIIFPFGQLRVGEMRVRFTESDPYEPQLEGRAEGMNFGYTVTMTVKGDLNEPEIRFSTVPPMSTREALQMLTAGTLPRSEYSFTDTQRVQKVGAFLATDLLSTLLGSDPTEESRFTIRSGQRVSSEGRLTYGIEYRLSDRWSLVGEYDRWSQINAGVRWRVLER
jgi:translocation and assembly module TamB